MATPVINRNITPDFNAMTLEQLHNEALRLAAILELCNNQRKEIWRIRERRKALAKAQVQVATLSDIEQDALRTILG